MRRSPTGVRRSWQLSVSPDHPTPWSSAFPRASGSSSRSPRRCSSTPGIIIFDEPTTSLTSRETSRLFELIARLAADGTTIIYISHILGDVQALADDIAVLRDGRLVATGPAPEFPVARMINLMLGRDIDQLYPPRTRASRDEVLLRGPRPDRSGRGSRDRPPACRRARSSASSA